MKRFYFAIILSCLIFVGCKPEVEIPTVVTQEIEEISTNTAKVTYNVVDDGGAEVTSRGVCWSTSNNPTIDDNKTNDGSGVGTFTSQLQDLLSDTMYYVRAYAVNSAGVSYGEAKTFETLAEESDDDNTDDNTGNEVTVVDVENGKLITINGVSFRMIYVENGTFEMGAQNVDPNAPNYDSTAWEREAPVHSVTLSDYYIAETEVTQELWEAVMGYNPSHFLGAQKPVEQVTWSECNSFILGLCQLTGMDFRFPTEAEWEFAARGGNESAGYKYSGSDNIDEVAWYSADGKRTRDVNSYHCYWGQRGGFQEHCIWKYM